jgi:hypothetical protein
MNVFPTNPTLAQQQADSLNGNAPRSLEQFKNTLVHAVWYFARVQTGGAPTRRALRFGR